MRNETRKRPSADGRGAFFIARGEFFAWGMERYNLKESGMPEISRFFGISIRMYFDDHAPAHFHAIYAGKEVEIGIMPLSVLQGSFPRRALGLVLEWASEHQSELMENWERLHHDLLPQRIQPLN